MLVVWTVGRLSFVIPCAAPVLGFLADFDVRFLVAFFLGAAFILVAFLGAAKKSGVAKVISDSINLLIFSLRELVYRVIKTRLLSLPIDMCRIA